MFSILKSLWLSTQTTTILIRLSDCFFVLGGIKLRSKQTKKITGVGQTNNDDFEGINPPPTTIFWEIHPHPRRFFGESTHTHDDFLGNPPTPTTIFGGIHPHPRRFLGNPPTPMTIFQGMKLCFYENGCPLCLLGFLETICCCSH